MFLLLFVTVLHYVRLLLNSACMRRTFLDVDVDFGFGGVDMLCMRLVYVGNALCS